MAHPPQPIPDPPSGPALPSVMSFDGNPPRSISADDSQLIADFLQAEGLLSGGAKCWLLGADGQIIRLQLPPETKQAMRERIATRGDTWTVSAGNIHNLVNFLCLQGWGDIVTSGEARRFGFTDGEPHLWVHFEGQKAIESRLAETAFTRWHREHPVWAAVLYASLGGLVAHVAEWLGRMWP